LELFVNTKKEAKEESWIDPGAFTTPKIIIPSGPNPSRFVM
jgi:hypothetical protein